MRIESDEFENESGILLGRYEPAVIKTVLLFKIENSWKLKRICRTVGSPYETHETIKIYVAYQINYQLIISLVKAQVYGHIDYLMRIKFKRITSILMITCIPDIKYKGRKIYYRVNKKYIIGLKNCKVKP